MTSGDVQTLHFLLPSGGLSVAKPNAICSSSPAFNTHFGVCATLAAGFGGLPRLWALNMSIAPMELICQVRNLHEIGS